MNNQEKITEMLKNDPELAEKLAAETKRLADSGKKDVREITAESIKAVFGIDLTDEELDQVAGTAAKAAEEATKLDLDELDDVAGGEFSLGTLGKRAAAGAVLGGTAGAMGGAVAGSCFPVVGNVIGGILGAIGGAAVFGAVGGISYVVNET